MSLRSRRAKRSTDLRLSFGVDSKGFSLSADLTEELSPLFPIGLWAISAAFCALSFFSISDRISNVIADCRPLVISEIAPPQLMRSNPEFSVVTVCQFDFSRFERQTVLFSNLVAVVSIKQDTLPNGEWFLDFAILQDVRFKLFELFGQ